MAIKKHPEWSKFYPAIDGIEKKAQYIKDQPYNEKILFKKAEKPIRSDIEEILKLDNVSFSKWYNERKAAAKNLLKQYELIGSIPALACSSEHDKFDLTSNCNFNGTVNLLKEGLDYLEKIKEVREEYRK